MKINWELTKKSASLIDKKKGWRHIELNKEGVISCLDMYEFNPLQRWIIFV